MALWGAFAFSPQVLTVCAVARWRAITPLTIPGEISVHRRSSGDRSPEASNTAEDPGGGGCGANTTNSRQVGGGAGRSSGP